MIAVTLFAGYNAALLMIVGILMAVGDPLSGFHIWLTLGGILLVALGILFAAGGFGLWVGRVWARKLLFWCFAANLPLFAVAIFPIFQNDRMTTGNTLLQTAGIIGSLVVLKALAGAHSDAPGGHPPIPSVRDEMPDSEEEEAPFTLDRNHKGYDPFP